MKKFLSLLLALTLVFALVACSNEKDTTSEPDTSTITQTESTDNTETTDSDTTDESSSDTETPSNSTPTSTETSKPTTSNKDNTTSNKPSNTTSTPTTSKPTTSTPSTSTPSTSTPSTPQKELVNIRLTTDIPTKDLSGFNGADCISLLLQIKENNDGSFSSSYEIVGWKSVNLSSATNTEQETLLNSVEKYQDFYLYPDIYSGLYWGWVTYGYGDAYPTFNDLKTAIGIGYDKNSNTEYFPSELFGNRIVIFADNIKCSYNKETGKVILDDNFPLKDFCIKDNKTFTIGGKSFNSQSISGYEIG